MDKKDLHPYFSQKKYIKLTCRFHDSDPLIYYNGVIQKLDDDTVAITDRFGKLVTINIIEIIRIEESDPK
jgi:hypothetical protein